MPRPPQRRDRALLRVPAPVTVRVPAKINLYLAVGSRRDDGYHELTTVFHAVSLHDELTVHAAERLSLTLRGEGAAALPVDEGNLAIRAARALATYAGIEPRAALAIDKGIPVAGGLAGGSADAAAALVGCDALWGTGLDRAALARLGAGLGSDVPFALHGGTALGTGRGELLTPALSGGEFHWVLAPAAGGLSTPAVYAELDRLRDRGHPPPAREPTLDAVLAALRAGDAARLGLALRNDLQPAALNLRPALRRTLASGLELGALGAVVSGSGPTCAFLVNSAEEGIAFAAALAAEGVCRGVRRAVGPVTGARPVGPAEG